MTELENRWLDLGEFIREQRRIGELSLRKLSEMAGISNPYLSQIERGLRKPSAEILQQIARALEISSETLYVRAGILDDEREHDVITEIRRDPSIDEDQKKALISIYESFRTENAAKAVVLDEVLAEAAVVAIEEELADEVGARDLDEESIEREIEEEIEDEIEDEIEEAVDAEIAEELRDEVVIDDLLDDDPLLDEAPVEEAPVAEAAEPSGAAAESLAER